MTRPFRIGLIVIASLVVVALVVILGGIAVLRSNWFFERVRERVVAEMERSTGGKVELETFHLDWRTLTAEVGGLVIHGTEPPGEAPLLRVSKIRIGLTVSSLLKRQFDIASVDVLDPQTNLLISSDGQTNIPDRKPREPSKSIDQTILDLAVGRFGAQNGMVRIKAAGSPPQKFPWTATGENLRAVLNYLQAGPQYTGSISVQPIHYAYSNHKPVDIAVYIGLKFERDHIQISEGRLKSQFSEIDFTGDLQHLQSPRMAGKYRARVVAQEVGTMLAWRTAQTGILDASGDFRFTNPEDFLVQGKVHAVDLSYRDADIHLQNLQLNSEFLARPKTIEMMNLRAALLGGEVRGRATLANRDAFEVTGKIAGIRASRLANIVRAAAPPIDPSLSGPFEARGSLAGLKYRRINASAQLTLASAGAAPVSGFVDARYDSARQHVEFAKSFVALPSSRVDFSGGLGVRPGSYAAQIEIRLTSGNLNDALLVAPAAKQLPLALKNGRAGFNGTVAGAVSSPVIQGHVTANNIVIEKQEIEAVSADINARSTEVQVQNGELAYHKMRARVAGTLALSDWKPGNQSALKAAASLQNADFANLFALVGQAQIPIKGSIAADAEVSGTLADPRATATLRAGKGSAYGEPFDRATAKLTYVNERRQEFNAEIDAGSRKVELTGSFQHAPAELLDGTIQARVNTTHIALNQVQRIHQYQPTIGGVARAAGNAEIKIWKTRTGEQFELVNLNADLFTRNLAVDQKQLGDVHLTAHTSAGQTPPVVTVKLESNMAHSTIRGNGTWQLSRDHPGSGELIFTNVNLADVRKLFAPHASSLASLGGCVEGKITLRGPVDNPRVMTGSLEIPNLEIKPEPGGETPLPESLRGLVIRNEGTIRAEMNNGNIRVVAARVTARSTDMSLVGTVNLNAAAPLNLRASGNVDLTILQMFERNMVSSGTVAATATIRGTFGQPEILGRMDVKNANLNLEGLPNGLSNANGTVIFDPSRATIQSLTGETGGGKVNLTGFASFSSGPMALRLEAAATEVRIRYPEGVSTVADFNLRLIGTTERSTLSGTVTVLRSAFTPRTDLGSLLAKASAPVQTPAAQTGLVGNVQFDVDIQTAPDVSLQTSLTSGLQADANLRLRGTITNPVLLGRVNVSQGDLTFFGNKYTINDGSISFFNPVKLDPILDFSLETRARGVDVTINITGPVTKPNVTYRSDPPLQFADLVALLATGRTPENPTIAARDPGTTQTWQEMGASALLGQAIANPLAGRLQRFFGVSKIKIDPLLTGVAGNAQARLTIEQNVTPDLTFTYITNVASTTGSAQVIRIEWNFSRYWSAVAVRDEYGYFGIDFQYRKRLK